MYGYNEKLVDCLETSLCYAAVDTNLADTNYDCNCRCGRPHVWSTNTCKHHKLYISNNMICLRKNLQVDRCKTYVDKTFTYKTLMNACAHATHTPASTHTHTDTHTYACAHTHARIHTHRHHYRHNQLSREAIYNTSLPSEGAQFTGAHTHRKRYSQDSITHKDTNRTIKNEGLPLYSWRRDEAF